MTVLVYQDYVHNNGILFRRLAATFGPENVRFCDGGDILAGALDDARTLVMPGGADLYYTEKLNGPGNAAIRAFVENGGAYLGICAGAYYACRAIEWAKSEAAPICGPRELAFCGGLATGPVYDFIENRDFTRSWDAAVDITLGNETHSVLYSGGPVFSQLSPGDTVLARYAALPGHPAAIVECAVGAGIAVLCGPHIEYDRPAYESTLYRHNNRSYDWQVRAAQNLAAPADHDPLWRTIMDRLTQTGAQRHAA